MSSRRVLKAAQAIREVVSMAIITDLKDPRIRDVTVTLVEVSPDMRQAKVNVSVMGDQTKQDLCLRGLQSSAGFLQQKVGKRIDTRYTPRIQFVLDKGIKHALMVTRILEDVLPKEDSNEAEDSGSGDSADLPENAASDSNSDAADHDPALPEAVELPTQPTDHSDKPR
jgi:ribosome-binding factor A